MDKRFTNYLHKKFINIKHSIKENTDNITYQANLFYYDKIFSNDCCVSQFVEQLTERKLLMYQYITQAQLCGVELDPSINLTIHQKNAIKKCFDSCSHAVYSKKELFNILNNCTH